MSNNLFQIQGAIYGSLIGDSQGRPCYNPTSALMLCTMQEINENNEIDENLLMERFQTVYITGEFILDDAECEIDIISSQSIKSFMNGMPPDKCGIRNKEAASSEVIPRILPVAIFYAHKSTEHFVDRIHKICSLTHNYPLTCVCSAIYAMIVRSILTGKPEKVFNTLQDVYQRKYSQEYLEELQYLRTWKSNFEIEGSTFVADSFWSAWDIYSNHETEFDLCLSESKKYTNANDIGSMACSLSGLKIGINDIPSQHIRKLLISDVVKNTIDNFSKKNVV